MFYINLNDDKEKFLSGISTQEALERLDKGEEIYNRRAEKATREEIVDFLNSGYKSIYD